MQVIHKAYLSVLQSALWGTEWQGFEDLSSDPVAQVVRLAAMHSTGPLIYPLLLANEGVQHMLDADLKTQMKAVCAQTMQQQVKLQHTLLTAWQALTEAGIRPVLMKGAGLASLYEKPYFRSWGDVDLFVGKNQYHPACAVMRETFPAALKFDEELDHYKHYNLIADGISIEIHRVSLSLQHPLDARRYERIEREGMSAEHVEEIRVGDTMIAVPEPTYNALLVFMHSWEHMMTEGACMRQLCDLALLLHRYAAKIDRTKLKRDVQRLHMMDIWQVYMGIMVEYMGLPAEKAPFYSHACIARSEALLTDLLSGRMRLIKSDKPAPKNRIARKWHTMKERLNNARRMARYSSSFARHMTAEILLHGMLRFFAKDRHWE